MTDINDMEKFKQDYPTMYERFLRMNNALAGLQKAAKSQGPNTVSGTVFPKHDDMPTLLELE